jgi:hypothetical protein
MSRVHQRERHWRFLADAFAPGIKRVVANSVPLTKLTDALAALLTLGP